MQISRRQNKPLHLVVGDLDLAIIHELEQSVQLERVDVFEKYDRMFERKVGSGEQTSKVWTADGEDKTVGLERIKEKINGVVVSVYYMSHLLCSETLSHL